MSSKILKLSTALFSVFVAHTATAEMATNNGVKGHINPYIDVTAKGGTVGKDSKDKTLKRALVRPDVFLPVYQNEDSLFALDIRGMKDFMNDQVTSMEGNFGAVYRKQVGSDSVAGFAAFFDLRRETYKGDYEANKEVGITEDVNKDFKSVTLNAHLLTSGFQLQGNLYVPLNKSNDDPIVADANVPGNVKSKTLNNGDTFLLPSGLPISGLVYEANGAQGGIFQRALLGFDAYASYALPTFKNLRLGARYYNFWDHNSDGDSSEVSKSGVGANVVFQLNRYFYIEGEVNYQTDKDFAGNKSNNWHNFIGARVRIPLGGFDSELSDIDQLFTQQVRRDVDVVTGLTSKASVAADPSKIVVDGFENTSEFKVAQAAPADAAAIATTSYNETTFVKMFKDAKVKQEAGKADAANLDDATVTAILAKFFPDAQDATKPAANVSIKKKDNKPDVTITVKVKAADAASASALAAVVGKSENVTYDDFKKNVLDTNYDASSKAFRAVIADSSLSYKKAFADLDKHKTDKLAGINKDTQADLYNAVDVMTTAVKGEALAGVIDPNNTHADAAHKITTEERAKLDSSAALTRLAVLGGKADAATLLSDTITTPDTFGAVTVVADKAVADVTKNLSEGTFSGSANNKTLNTKEKQVAALETIKSDENKQVMAAYLAKKNLQDATVYLAGNTDPDATKAEFTLPADAAASKERVTSIQKLMEQKYDEPGVNFSNIYKVDPAFQEAMFGKAPLANVEDVYVKAIQSNLFSGTPAEATTEKALIKQYVAAPTPDNSKKFVGDSSDVNLNQAYIDNRYGQVSAISGLDAQQTAFNELIAKQVNDVSMKDILTGSALFTLNANGAVVKGLNQEQMQELRQNLRTLATADLKTNFVKVLTGGKLKLAGTDDENKVVAENVELYVTGSSFGKDKTTLEGLQALTKTKIVDDNITADNYIKFARNWRKAGVAAVKYFSASASTTKIYSGTANGGYTEVTVTADQLKSLRAVISDYIATEGLNANDDAAQWADFKKFADNLVGTSAASQALRSWLVLNNTPAAATVALTAVEKKGLYTIGSYLNDANKDFIATLLKVADTSAVAGTLQYKPDPNRAFVDITTLTAAARSLALYGQREAGTALTANTYSSSEHKNYLSIMEKLYNAYVEEDKVKSAHENILDKNDTYVKSEGRFRTYVNELSTVFHATNANYFTVSDVKAIFAGKLKNDDLFGANGDAAAALAKDLQNMLIAGLLAEEKNAGAGVAGAAVREKASKYIARIRSMNDNKLADANHADAAPLDKIVKLGTLTDSLQRGFVLYNLALAYETTDYNNLAVDGVVSVGDKKGFVDKYLIDKFVAIAADNTNSIFAVKANNRYKITTADNANRDPTNQSGYVVRPVTLNNALNFASYIGLKGIREYIKNVAVPADQATEVSDAFTLAVDKVKQAAKDPRVLNTFITGTFQSKAYLNKNYTALTSAPDWDTALAKTSGRQDADVAVGNLEDVTMAAQYAGGGNNRNLLAFLDPAAAFNHKSRAMEGLRDILGDADYVDAAKFIVSVMGYIEGTKLDANLVERDTLVKAIETAIIGAPAATLANRGAANVTSADLLLASQVKAYRKAMLGGAGKLNIIQVGSLYDNVGTNAGGMGANVTLPETKLAYSLLFGNGAIEVKTTAGSAVLFAADSTEYTSAHRENLIAAIANKDVNWVKLKDDANPNPNDIVSDDGFKVTRAVAQSFFQALDTTGTTADATSKAKDIAGVKELLTKGGNIASFEDGEHRQLLGMTINTFAPGALKRIGNLPNTTAVEFNTARAAFNSITLNDIWSDDVRAAVFGRAVFTAGSSYNATDSEKDADVADKAYSSRGRVALFNNIINPAVTNAAIIAGSKFGLSNMGVSSATPATYGVIDNLAVVKDKVAAAVKALKALKDAGGNDAELFKILVRGSRLVDGALENRTPEQLNQLMFFVVDSAGIGADADFYEAANEAANNARVKNVVTNFTSAWVDDVNLKTVLYGCDDTSNNAAFGAGDAVLKYAAAAATTLTGYDYRLLGRFLESSLAKTLVEQGLKRLAAPGAGATGNNQSITASFLLRHAGTNNYAMGATTAGGNFNQDAAHYATFANEVSEYSQYMAHLLMASNDTVTSTAYPNTRPLELFVRLKNAYTGIARAGYYNNHGTDVVLNTDKDLTVGADRTAAVAAYVGANVDAKINSAATEAKKAALIFVGRISGKGIANKPAGADPDVAPGGLFPVYHPSYTPVIGATTAGGAVPTDDLLVKVIAKNFTNVAVDWANQNASTIRNNLDVDTLDFAQLGGVEAASIVGSLAGQVFTELTLLKTIGGTQTVTAIKVAAAPGGNADDFSYLVDNAATATYSAGRVTDLKGGVAAAGAAGTNSDANVAAQYLTPNFTGADDNARTAAKNKAKLMATMISQLIKNKADYEA